MSVVLTQEEYNAHKSHFTEITSIDEVVGAKVGHIWNRVMNEEGNDCHLRVCGFVRSGEDILALLGEGYNSSFHFLSWVGSRVSFPLRVSLTPFNYWKVFSKANIGSIREKEDVLQGLVAVGRPAGNFASEKSIAEGFSGGQAGFGSPDGWGTVGVVNNSWGTPNNEGADFDDGGATSVLSEECFVLMDNASRFEVYDEGVTYTLGRSESCNFRIHQGGVSRKHLQLKFGDGVLLVYDEGTTNGTRVNGSRIPSHQWVSVYSGSTLRVGRVSLKVVKEEL